MYLDEANTGESCLIKQPQKQLDLNNAKCTSGFKYTMNLENFDTKFVRICEEFIGKLALKCFFVAKVFSH